MGYQVLLDILGAMFIGGILMLSLFQVNTNTVLNLGYYNTDFLLQQNLLMLVRQIESDLKRIGYSQNIGIINSTRDAIITADTATITMVGDFDNSGSVDTVKYFIGPLSELSASINPRDRILYRQEGNNPAQKIFFGITVFDLTYFDPFGTEIPAPIPRAETGAVASIQISVRAESGDAYDSKYADVYWRQIRLSARNLNNR